MLNKLNTIKEIKAGIKSALVYFNLSPGDRFADYPDLIRSLKASSGNPFDEQWILTDETVNYTYSDNWDYVGSAVFELYKYRYSDDTVHGKMLEDNRAFYLTVNPETTTASVKYTYNPNEWQTYEKDFNSENGVLYARKTSGSYRLSSITITGNDVDYVDARYLCYMNLNSKNVNYIDASKAISIKDVSNVKFPVDAVIHNCENLVEFSSGSGTTSSSGCKLTFLNASNLEKLKFYNVNCFTEIYIEGGSQVTGNIIYYSSSTAKWHLTKITFTEPTVSLTHTAIIFNSTGLEEIYGLDYSNMQGTSVFNSSNKVLTHCKISNLNYDGTSTSTLNSTLGTFIPNADTWLEEDIIYTFSNAKEQTKNRTLSVSSRIYNIINNDVVLPGILAKGWTITK